VFHKFNIHEELRVMNIRVPFDKVWHLVVLVALFALPATFVRVSASGSDTDEGEDAHQVYIPFLSMGSSIVQGSSDILTGLTGFEPTVGVVNPRNPAQVAIARGCTVLISNDYGQTYPIIRNSSIGCNGDPSIGYDSQGRLFMSHLSRAFPGNELTVVAAQIANITTTGNQNYNPVQVSQTDGLGDDKQWLAVDANPHSPFRDNLYLVWTRNPTIPCNFPNCSVMFSRSTNQGATWSAPQVISANGEGFVWPANAAVGPNGDLYVAYHTSTCGGAGTGNIPLLRDGAGGANFAAGTVPQKNNAFAAGQATITCNVQNNPLSGTEIPNADFWLQGSVQPWILPDPVRAGSIYVVANDDPNNNFGNGDDADVVIARSNDHGVTFSRNRADHGPGQSFAVMPTAHIDQDGNIAISWYDNRRNLLNTGANANFGSANFLLDLYGTVSVDGGLSFSNDFRINDTPFDPDASTNCRFGTLAGNNCTSRIGEYNGIFAVNGLGYAVWTGNTTPPPAPFPSNGAGLQTTFDLFSMVAAYPDRLEPNEAIDFSAVAALGADDTYNEQTLSLHSATDVDFFKVVAMNTGKLRAEIEFNEIVASLQIQAIDRYGNTVGSGTITTLQTGSSVNAVTIPVIAGEIYFFQVFDPNAPNTFPPQISYDMSIINTGVPAPFGLDLVAASDSGMSDFDNITNVSLPTVQLRVDEGFLSGLSFSPTNDSNLADDSPGYKIQVFRNGTSVGFATPVGGQPGAYEVSFLDNPLIEGANSITARVNIVDPSNDPTVAGTAHVTGTGSESGSLLVTLDTTQPPPPSVPDLLPSSDSGPSDSDNVTQVNPPAFQGTGEANAKIRILANGDLVGQGLIGSDFSDGIPGNGLGEWEVTIEPLEDGMYEITADAEDLAGNISAPSTAMSPSLEIDTPDGGGTPQRPTLDLVDSYDMGWSNLDNVTNLTTLDFRVSAESGTMVVIKDGNIVIDNFAMPAIDFTIRTLNLTEGTHLLSTESTDMAGNTSHQSEELVVTVDETPPVVAAPDLPASSDSAGIDDDDVTTISNPSFVGQEEVNVLVRVYANGVQLGQSVVGSDASDGVPGNGLGAYTVSIEPLNDGVYNITVDLEDQAGNVSSMSPALPVTIANQVLNLSGASASVLVYLENHQVTGFPGYPSAGSTVGILGIPTVNLDMNGHALTILGTSLDDNLTFTPTDSQGGIVRRTESDQVLHLANIGETFEIDPGTGTDAVEVIGTSLDDLLTAEVDTTSSIQVNSLQNVTMPTANIERLGIFSQQGQDTLDIFVFDTVNAYLLVDAGEPASTNPVADTLNVYAASSQGHLQKQPGGPVQGSGSIFVTYPMTTEVESRIDYAHVEKISLIK
jgi:hypothetical protein